MDKEIIIDWVDINDSAIDIANGLLSHTRINDLVVLAPHYGGWPVASIVINKIRSQIGNDSFKPSVLLESDLSRHFLIPLLQSKTIVIFDDVLDTGKVINNIIWRILHECETFISKEEILKKIIICTIGKKRNCEYDCRHIYTHTWPVDSWIKYPWE